MGDGKIARSPGHWQVKPQQGVTACAQKGCGCLWQGGWWLQRRCWPRRGQVTGISQTPAGEQHGFVAEDGVVTDLGPADARGYSDLINARGQVLVNRFTDGKMQAAIWDHGTTTDLPTLGGELILAGAINDAGQVAGYSSVATGERHAFLWDNGVMTDLGTLNGANSTAAAINDAGEDNKKIARRMTEEPWNEGRLETLDEICAPAYRLQGQAGVAELKQEIAAFRRAFPDLHMTIEEMVAEGDTVVSRWTMRGTHLGPFEEIAPTGKTVAASGISIFHFADGKIVDDFFESSTPPRRVMLLAKD